MDEAFEEKYGDVLQNIEFALVTSYNADAVLTDWDALRAVQALIHRYQSEARGRPAPAQDLKPAASETYARVLEMCEWRLGRERLTDVSGRLIAADMQPKTLDEIVACLKRIRRSIEKWQKIGGQRGYYDFVSQFVR